MRQSIFFTLNGIFGFFIYLQIGGCVKIGASSFFQRVVKNINPNLSPEDYAVVTMPKRRHKVRNFVTLIFISIAEQLGLPFFEDCAFAPSKHRVGTVFTANNIPPLRNIIVFDDFVTTGQTLVSMQNLLVSLGKNCVFFTGINNKL